MVTAADADVPHPVRRKPRYKRWSLGKARQDFLKKKKKNVGTLLSSQSGSTRRRSTLFRYKSVVGL